MAIKCFKHGAVVIKVFFNHSAARSNLIDAISKKSAGYPIRIRDESNNVAFVINRRIAFMG